MLYLLINLNYLFHYRFKIPGSTWENTEFFLIAGKGLDKKESVIRIKYRKEFFQEVLTTVRAIEREYSFPFSEEFDSRIKESKENVKQKETELVKKGNEEIIYGKLNDEDKDVEIKKVKVEMTTDNEEIVSLKSLCLILQVQPNPVSINDLHIDCNEHDCRHYYN